MLKTLHPPRTFWLELTGWRWPMCERTLFGPIFRFAWFGVGISKHELTDWIESWRGKIKEVLIEDNAS